MVGVIGGLELEVHEVAGADGGGKEEHLHGRVVGRDEVGEQVQVTRDEHLAAAAENFFLSCL
jgi:hypothetical protein